MSATVRITTGSRETITVKLFDFIKDSVTWLLLNGFIRFDGDDWSHPTKYLVARLDRQHVDTI